MAQKIQHARQGWGRDAHAVGPQQRRSLGQRDACSESRRIGQPGSVRERQRQPGGNRHPDPDREADPHGQADALI